MFWMEILSERLNWNCTLTSIRNHVESLEIGCFCIFVLVTRYGYCSSVYSLTKSNRSSSKFAQSYSKMNTRTLSLYFLEAK